MIVTRALVASIGIAGLVLPLASTAQGSYPIISQEQAVTHGLHRAFFAQVQVDTSRHRLQELLLDGDFLLAQTDGATIHAINSETGATYWSRRVGEPLHPTLRPAINKFWVAVVNGSRLYVLDRKTGKLLWETMCESAPGAGPALSEERVYVPMIDGRVFAYYLEDKKPASTESTEEDSDLIEQNRGDVLVCQSFGRAMVQPIVTREEAGEECVAWATDRGYLFFGRINRIRADRFTFDYLLEAAGGLVAQPTYLPPDPDRKRPQGIIFGVSGGGFVYTLRERDGKALWRFSIGEPIVEPVVPVGDEVYVTTLLGGIYCIETNTAQLKWSAPGCSRFIAASNERVYAVDRWDRLWVLHRANGARLDQIDVAAYPIRLMNFQTDRIYLATARGLIQCLREQELTSPIQHQPKPAPAKPAAKQPPQAFGNEAEQDGLQP